MYQGTTFMAIPQLLCPLPWKSRPSGWRWDTKTNGLQPRCRAGYTNPEIAL